MPLLLTNDDVEKVIEMPAALEAMESALLQFANGDAVVHPRTALWSPTATEGDYYRWSCQLGSIRSPPRFTIRFKSEVLQWTERDDGSITESKFNVTPGTYMGLIQLFDTSDGALIGIIPDGIIQHVRTATTAGIACKYLAREDATSVGILGAGGMADKYLDAFASVRDLTEVTVYSPTEQSRQDFAELKSESLGIPVTAVERPEEVVKKADIVATCTNSLKPVYDPDWIEPGQFIVNVAPVEIPEEAIDRVDAAFSTRETPGNDHVIGSEADKRRIDDFYPQPSQEKYTFIGDVLTGDHPGRTGDDETIFYQNLSIGGLQFTSIGTMVHDRAVERDAGTVLPLEWFQEDIKA